MSRDIRIKYKSPSDNEFYASIDVYPATCPFCKKGVEFMKHHAYAVDDFRGDIQVILQCPRNECRRYVMAIYTFSSVGMVDPDGYPDSYMLDEVLPERPVGKRDFPAEIADVSPEFTEIYNQAYAAEQLQLDQISGAGFRKALEFLIKDFACREHSSERANKSQVPWKLYQ